MHNRIFTQEMQEEHIETTTVKYDNGTEWVLEFYLQSLKTPEGDNLYGVKINRSTLEGVLAESNETFAATENIDEALTMIRAFSRGKVLPISLPHMVDDWVLQV